MSNELDSPALVMHKLASVENDLAIRQNLLEDSARRWYTAQREIGRVRAQAMLTSRKPTVAEKKAEGDLAAYDVEGAASEAEYKACKAFVDMLEQRAMILMSLLKSQGRA